MMRIFGLILGLCLGTVCNGGNAVAADMQKLTGRVAPTALALPDPDGRQRSLEEFQGQVVVVNFWASWCPPCLREFPSLEQLSRDHSIIQELVDQGLFESAEEARGAGVKNNIITRGLGITHEVEVEEGADDVQTGDLFLFCSDGLSDMVADPVLEVTLNSAGDGLSELCGKLLDLAIQSGGRDNVSVILVRPEV